MILNTGLIKLMYLNEFVMIRGKGIKEVRNLTNAMTYETRRFYAAFTSALQVESTQFLVLITIYLIFILILSSHLHLGVPKGLLPVGLPVKVLKELLSFSILPTRPSHLNLLDLIILNILGEWYKYTKMK